MGFDMKWTILASIIFLTTGCCCTNQVVEYRQVRVARVVPVVTRIVTPVIEPVRVDYVEPIDVTTTSIDFY